MQRSARTCRRTACSKPPRDRPSTPPDRAEGAHMLVLGSRRAGIRRPAGPTVPLGPIVRDCLRGAPCPVLVVPPGYAESPASPVAGPLSRDPGGTTSDTGAPAPDRGPRELRPCVITPPHDVR